MIKTSNNKTYHVHENCLTYTSRKSPDETDEDAVKRTLEGVYKKIKCSHPECKQTNATVGCNVMQCRKVYHYGCAKKAEGELGCHGKFYCSAHIQMGIKDKAEGIRWPDIDGVTYIPRNDWSAISDRDKQYIQQRKQHWEKTPMTEFFRTDLQARVKVREIYPGHWAWCGSIEEESKAQYELITQERVEKDEFICEYTGEVKYLVNIAAEGSRYMTEIYIPEDIHLSGALVVDAGRKGNEARFINSVTPDTGGQIQKNATMMTVWCRGAIRVVVFATKDIPKNQPVILDYDEHNNSYFEKGTPHNSPIKAQHSRNSNTNTMIIIDED